MTRPTSSTEELLSAGVAVSTEHRSALGLALGTAYQPEVGDFDLYLITAGSWAMPSWPVVMLGGIKDLGGQRGWSDPLITAIASSERRPDLVGCGIRSGLLIGRPSNYHYGSAKAALTALCEGCCFAVKASRLRCGSSRPDS